MSLMFADIIARQKDKSSRFDGKKFSNPETEMKITNRIPFSLKSVSRKKSPVPILKFFQGAPKKILNPYT